MQNFEYRVIDVRRPHLENEAALLASEGARGWELVSVLATFNGRRLYFKRAVAVSVDAKFRMPHW